MSVRRSPRFLAAVLAPVLISLLLLSPAGANRTLPPDLKTVTLVGNDGAQLSLGHNQSVGAVSINDSNRGVCTVIWMPLPAFFDLVKALHEAPTY